MTPRFGCLYRSFRLCSIAACTIGAPIAAHAQNSISFLSPVYVRLSTNGTGYGSSAVTFSSAAQQLTCPAPNIDTPIVAKVSSTPDGSGNVLVDNFVNLTVVQGTSAPIGPSNICRGGVVENGTQNDCFNSQYQGLASGGGLTGQDPDGAIAAAGGVPPIDISSQLAPGTNTVTLGLVDTGGYLAATSIYLYTNCTSNGAVGGGQITGNPIPSTNPPANLLTQNFPFSSTPNQNVVGVVDFSTAEQQGTLTIVNQTTPIVSDQALNIEHWPDYVAGTSFATSHCLIHFGEKLRNGEAACKLYTVVCEVGQAGNPTGTQCPTSSARNIVIQDVFDGPTFYLPNIHVDGVTYHQGFGFLEAKEEWTGGPCTFDPGSDQIFNCPENLLTLFTGPGTTKGSGTPNGHLNSTFISVGPVPEYLTSVSIPYTNPRGSWVNQHDVTATFQTIPPVVPVPNNGFVAAPAYSITYGVSAPDAVPSPEFPVPGDLSLYTQAGCPGSTPATPFQPGPVTLTLADGKYLVHYFATDCAGTEELMFYQDATHSWNTTFYTAALNVDTVQPQIVSWPTLSPPPTIINGKLGYATGAHVTLTIQCTDDSSGVQQCGPKYFSDPITDPAPVKVTVGTATAGPHTYTVVVKDAAKNVGTPITVDYGVIQP